MISRFNFNITFLSNFFNIFKLLFFSNNNKIHQDLNYHLSKSYKNSSFYFFNYGRTAFYEMLLYIKSRSKKRKIIINSLTLFEIVNVIIYAGFEPIFIDTEKNSFNTNIKLDKSEMNLKEVAAVVITHLNGANSDVINIKNELDNYNKTNDKIYLIEDCAVSFGAKIGEKNVGTFGDFSFLSFNIMKNITCYTGGVLIDNDKALSNYNINHYNYPSVFNIIEKIIFVMVIQFLNSKIIFPLFFSFIKLSHKYSFKPFLAIYRSDFVITLEKNFPNRFKYLMHPFQKKILNEQFKHLENNRSLRCDKAKVYYEGLKNNKYLKFPQSEFNDKNIFIDFPIICSSEKTKNQLFDYFLIKKLDVKNYYYRSCSADPIYHFKSTPCVNSNEVAKNIIMLPLNKQITPDYQKKIINEINTFLS